MSPITRRQSITASAAGSVAVLAIASDAVIQAKSASSDAPKADTLQVLTPDQIVEGKVEGPVRVNGTIKLYPKDGGRALYWLRIDNLDQIESVCRE